MCVSVGFVYISEDRKVPWNDVKVRRQLLVLVLPSVLSECQAG